MFIEESLYFAEWNYLYIVIQVYMVCTGNNQQFLIITLQLFKSIFTEITGMRLFAMYQEYRTADFITIRKLGRIDK